MTGHRVLIVDDEPQILRFLKPSLVAAGYEVVAAATGGEALKAAATRAPDVIVLDLGLPDMDGKDVIRELRTWCKTPILVLSARDREAEKIAALDLGADDYINKPFGIGELTARLRTALRHAAQASGEQSRFQSGALEIDVLAHSVTWAGVPLKLTPKEFYLLAVLVRNAGRVVTHRQILTAVWGPAHTEDLQYLRVFIGQLRQKLRTTSGAPEFILTEPGIGYRLAAE
ncbi:MAG: response regulator [Hyphomicrobium sp.]|jgi:two-component system KDP operon response regulator KdpE|uniref:response regulator n=1 Tax=Hyphomicrobium sp. TaxID=82 RepID=UPI0025C3CF56|nr:response regulator [Hyphomicrobium sp.]MBX9863267.1 response regulator [Hyphomicrobium sp.]